MFSLDRVKPFFQGQTLLGVLMTVNEPPRPSIYDTGFLAEIPRVMSAPGPVASHNIWLLQILMWGITQQLHLRATVAFLTIRFHFPHSFPGCLSSFSSVQCYEALERLHVDYSGIVSSIAWYGVVAVSQIVSIANPMF